MHIPVLLSESVDLLDINPGRVYIDATLGGAGHAAAILDNLTDGVLIGIDRDEAACGRARDILTPKNKNSIHIINDNFTEIKRICRTLGINGADGILFDFGVSSFQLDDAAEGFSYMRDAPLDMRMDKTAKKTAADIVNTYTESELSKIIRNYGEERWAARIAEFIVTERSAGTIVSSFDLVGIIKKAIPKSARQDGPHPAKRTFQALRIEVNGELDAIKKAVQDAADILMPEGRIVCISYHSLEDRIVKTVFRQAAAGCVCPREIPVCVCGKRPLLKIITNKPVTPQTHETESNPRARSAKLRAAKRL